MPQADVRNWLARASVGLPLCIVAAIAVGMIGVVIDAVHDKRAFSAFLFIRQDFAPAILIALLARYALRPCEASRVPAWTDALARRPWIVSCLLVVLCWAGHRWLLQGYDLTRDEQMTAFDAAIYAHRRLFWPIGQEWRPYAQALNQFFILPVADRQAWVSGYLPINALAHAIMGRIGLAGLVSPLFTGIGALALWRVTVRLWPDDRQASAVAMLLYAGSSQVVVQGMTSHAMAGHLALDMLWLLFFLRGGWSHAGAILIGFLATGLHQPIFHPLFVFPILTGLLFHRRWRIAAVYAVAYAAIGIFWFAWPNLIVDLAGGPLAGISSTGDRLGYVERITALLRDFGPASLWLMAMNVVRFVVWQHLLFVPLVAAGATLAWRQPLVRPLVAGILIHLILVGLLLAYQGHGWGYRYLHGVIGSCCILGGYGWRMARPLWPSAQVWNGGNAFTFVVLMPMHMAMAAWLTVPYAQVASTIGRLPADAVIVDDGAVAFGADLVVNRPDLSNRPIRLLASELDTAQAAALCRHRRVLFVDATALSPIGRAINAEPSGAAHMRALRATCPPGH